MTYEELVRRVYSARHALYQQGGTNFEAWVVYTSAEDFADLKVERAALEYGRMMPSGAFEMGVVGIPVRPDRNLRPGEVRMRTEVAA